MNPPNLDPDLAAALRVLAELGPLQVLDLHPTPPGRQPVSPPAPAPAATAPPQPSLFDPQQPPAPVLANPLGHPPSTPRWRPVLSHAGAPLSPTPPTRRSHP
jgi:hypothetical protein